MSAAATTGKTAYRIKADSIEACSCNHGCNCQFVGTPNEGLCEFVVGYELNDGTFGQIQLKGVRGVIVAKYPKAIHEGNGHVVLFIDDRATPEQADALVGILSGQNGGMPWEAIAGTIGRFEGPIRRRIDITFAAERSSIRVGDDIAVRLTPIKDAVSGEEKEVHIVYPKGGFFWNDGAIATTSEMRASHGDLRLNWPGRYAAVAEVNWTNQ